MPKNEFFYDKFKDKVIDGTRCNDDTYNMCADGVCKVIAVSSIYISGVRSFGHRVKPNMAVNGGPNLRRLSLPTRSFIFTCIVKIAQGD